MSMFSEVPRSNRWLPEINKISTRGPISSHDRQVVLQYLSDAEKDLNSYDLEVSKLKAAILMLEARQTGLKKAMEKYRSLLAPIRRLPSEVLLEIFSCFCEESYIVEDMVPEAQKLSSVCRHWREIVTSAPGLWSSFYIDFTCHRYSVAESYTKITSLFMSRSKTSPLHISMSFPLDEYMVFNVDVTLQLLVNHSHRWESLEVFGVEYFSRYCPGAFHLPKLRRLELNTDGDNSDDETETRLPSFSNCPALTTVYLHIAYPAAVDQIVLSWPQVRDLTVVNCFGRATFSALGRCGDLEQLTLLDIDDVFEYHEEAIAELPKTFSLPELTRLEIRSRCYQMPPERRSCIPLFLERFVPHSTITSLGLHSILLIDTQVLSLLHHMSALRILSISEYKGEACNQIVTRDFSRHLFLPQDTMVSSHPSFLPVLSELKLSIHFSGLDEQALADALTSRCLPVSRCLKMVDIALISKDMPPSGPLFALQYFKHVGLHFTLSHVEAVPGDA
ncbi:hypothetical protein AAF712_008868 [Marasmius tenuissimus]|uniref:F-box domain-containing protein n=1 Tax=Marasmius tenuissimus TaxID=585030 RepID=A0ABR2ZR31_9AGAR